MSHPFLGKVAAIANQQETIWSKWMNSAFCKLRSTVPLPHHECRVTLLTWKGCCEQVVSWEEGGVLHIFKSFWSNDLGTEASVHHNFLHKGFFFFHLNWIPFLSTSSPLLESGLMNPSLDLSDTLFTRPWVYLVWLCRSCVAPCLLYQTVNRSTAGASLVPGFPHSVSSVLFSALRETAVK